MTTTQSTSKSSIRRRLAVAGAICLTSVGATFGFLTSPGARPSARNAELAAISGIRTTGGGTSAVLYGVGSSPGRKAGGTSPLEY